MGYKCPNCHKDFGKGQDGKNNLQKHFIENPDCRVEAWVNTELFEKSLKIKGNNKINNSKVSHTKYQISDCHKWRKINIMTNSDGSDTVICIRCGLKAKRFGNTFKFDMRQKNKIQNCNIK